MRVHKGCRPQVLTHDSVTVAVDGVIYFSIKDALRVLTRDSVTVAVDGVIYFSVKNTVNAVTQIQNFSHSTRLLAATTLRNVLGTRNLAEILSERESISATMQSSLDDATDPWGVKVERVEIKDVRLPVQLQRAMAAEAEAAREARAKVIAAEGEQRASRALKEAAEVINESPAALQDGDSLQEYFIALMLKVSQEVRGTSLLALGGVSIMYE
ncbi:hypothetical protein Pmani_011956 [Petrolisthes manimaculis]|uniref:Band 7 domain-containing protein n=1 Tax=Petrolisthes manimaculis TaxID=1843537 RepID=A0AAE1PYN6_9EUCA|nr:hypothetical protein Pmani_011956 [Petrolisthes manimaculis]